MAAPPGEMSPGPESQTATTPGWLPRPRKIRSEGTTDSSDAATELKRIRHLLDQLPALVAYWDRELRNQVANAAYVEFFGFTPEQMRGMHISEVLGRDVFESNEPFLMGALGGERQQFERTLIDSDGRARHTEAHYLPDLVEGEVRGIFVLVVDVTRRVEAQQALAEAQELAELGSWTLQPLEGSLTWSREMYRLVGKDPATFVPTHEAYRSFVHPDDIDRVRAVQDEKLWSGENFDLHYRLVVDGEIRYVASRTRPVLSEEGETVLLRGTVQDETEAREQAAALEATNALLTNMVAMVGHDVRQPLGVILGSLEQILDTWPDGDGLAQQRRMIDLAYTTSRRLIELVQDILAMVNVDAGVLALNPREVDLVSVVNDVAAEVCAGKLDVVVAGSAQMTVRVDPFHLRQVLSNLIGNAERHGSAPVCVELTQGIGLARVTVIDHGAGVPEEFRPYLFERFTRAQTTLAAGTVGWGFGLFIVKELVEANGGTVEYAPNSPTGSRFTVTLPVTG